MTPHYLFICSAVKIKRRFAMDLRPRHGRNCRAQIDDQWNFRCQCQPRGGIMRSKRIACCLAFVLVGCPHTQTDPGELVPKSLGERSSGFGYIPLDGLTAIETLDPVSCGTEDQSDTDVVPMPIVQSLPDISVRFAVAAYTNEGALSWAPVQVTGKGQLYHAILDYVNVDEIPQTFWARKYVKTVKNEIQSRPILEALDSGDLVVGYDVRSTEPIEVTGSITTSDTARYQSAINSPDALRAAVYDELTIPIYVGIGVRLTADVQALQAGVALNSIGGIAASAERNALAGNLTIQTIGASGSTIATSLPLPNKMDQTTAENAIIGLATTRSRIYTSDGESNTVTRTPRVVALYSPVVADPRFVSAVYSQLAKKPPIWLHRCSSHKSQATGSPR